MDVTQQAQLSVGSTWRNGGAAYGRLTRIFHWTTATLMIVNVAIGLYSMTLSQKSQVRVVILDYHKSFGMLVIALTIARLIWLAYSPAHMEHKELQAWERLAAKIGHVLLYFILFLMPISGLIMSIGAGRKTTFFYLWTVPQFLPLTPGLQPHDQYFYILGKFLHESVFQWVLYAVFALHMAGVVKHRFIDGDRNFIRRMWSGRAEA